MRKPNETPDIPRSTETVLIVDDDPAVRNLLFRVLVKLGYITLCAENGEEAICLAREYHRTIDLLITDVVTPDMTGQYLARKVGRVQPGVKVLFTLGYTPDTLDNYGIPKGAINFIKKPVDVRTLTCKVQEILNQPDTESLI